MTNENIYIPDKEKNERIKRAIENTPIEKLNVIATDRINNLYNSINLATLLINIGEDRNAEYQMLRKSLKEFGLDITEAQAKNYEKALEGKLNR